MKHIVVDMPRDVVDVEAEQAEDDGSTNDSVGPSNLPFKAAPPGRPPSLQETPLPGTGDSGGDDPKTDRDLVSGGSEEDGDSADGASPQVEAELQALTQTHNVPENIVMILRLLPAGRLTRIRNRRRARISRRRRYHGCGMPSH